MWGSFLPLAGAGLFAAFGLGPAYLSIAGFYGLGFLLTLGVAGRRARLSPAGIFGAGEMPHWLRRLSGRGGSSS